MVETAAVEVGAGPHCWGWLGGRGSELKVVVDSTVVEKLWSRRGVYKNG